MRPAPNSAFRRARCASRPASKTRTISSRISPARWKRFRPDPSIQGIERSFVRPKGRRALLARPRNTTVAVAFALKLTLRVRLNEQKAARPRAAGPRSLFRFLTHEDCYKIRVTYID